MATRRRRRAAPDDEDAEELGEDLRAEWAAIWWRQMIVGLAGFGIGMTPILVLAFVYAPAEPPDAVAIPAFVVFAVFIAATLAFSLWNWRCPACRRYMGKHGFGIRFCHRCGARLG